ncbi:MAG: prepilin-type N-terminal cleavage/methylation domain-containing protein [Parcubacteria group bacterium]
MTKIKNYKFGFTLIEALVFLFIFTIITSTFYSVFSVNTRYTIDVKDRQSSNQIANEKMEIIRNMQYSDIGTIGGIPNGDIPAEENITVDGKTYAVRTFIKYQDDPFDGVYPTDTIPNDYKIVKVAVSWTGVSESDVELVSRFVPSGMELASGDGVLAINVINSEGQGVGQAEIKIENDAVSPTVDIAAETDDSGNLMFPGAKASIWGYKLTVSKNDYETVETVDPDSVEYNPIDSHASVVSGSVNTKTIILNKTSDVDIKSLDYLGVALPSVNFHFKGGRILGTDTSVPPANVYNTDHDYTTDLSGENKLDDRSPGQYVLSDVDPVSGYTLISTEPISPVTVLPNETKTVKIKFAKNDEDSLVVYVQKDSDSTPIEGATVHLTNGGGYDATITTANDGVAIFPLTAVPVFAPGDYNIEITADGFQDNNSTAAVDNFTAKTVKLTAT